MSDINNQDANLMAAKASQDVLTVPNAALRFRPNQKVQQNQKGTPVQTSQTSDPDGKLQAAGPDQPASQASANRPPDSGENGGRSFHEQTIWVLNADRRLKPHVVSAGLTNGRVTAISEGQLREGDVVVIGQI